MPARPTQDLCLDGGACDAPHLASSVFRNRAFEVTLAVTGGLMELDATGLPIVAVSDAQVEHPLVEAQDFPDEHMSERTVRTDLCWCFFFVPRGEIVPEHCPEALRAARRRRAPRGPAGSSCTGTPTKLVPQEQTVDGDRTIAQSVDSTAHPSAIHRLFCFDSRSLWILFSGESALVLVPLPQSEAPTVIVKKSCVGQTGTT